MRTSEVLNTIPDNAALMFEFNNDQSFYDIFTGNKLFKTVAGKQQLDDLDSLRKQLLMDPLTGQYFSGQNIYISIHPLKQGLPGVLLTLSAAKGFSPSVLETALKQVNHKMVITTFRQAGKQGYTVYLKNIKKSFFMVLKENNIFSGSFSRDLVIQSAQYNSRADKHTFVLLSEQQNANSLANLYVNYNQLSPLFDALFENKNSDIFKSFRLFPGLATLTLNFRSDALMFNGTTNIQKNQARGYLNIFSNQQPVVNHLKDIFPSTMAYGTNFAVSAPIKFSTDLGQWYNKAGLKADEENLFNKIKTETGSSLKTEFGNLLGNEFAIITTRYFEKFGIVSVNDGSKLSLLLSAIGINNEVNLSVVQPVKKGKKKNIEVKHKQAIENPGYFDENTGQFNYDKIPFFLLGDAFGVFRRPYFMVIDNYLILANSRKELSSFYDMYINRKFLGKNEQFNKFDNLMAERSNVSFFMNFRNAQPILKRDLYPDVYDAIESAKPGWMDFYGASWQFAAVDHNFYTNFCLQLSADTAVSKK